MASHASDPGRPMTSWQFGKHLVAAGIISQEELNRTRRVVIDATSGELVRIYTDRFGGNDSLARLAPMLEGLIPERSDDDDEAAAGPPPTPASQASGTPG